LSFLDLVFTLNIDLQRSCYHKSGKELHVNARCLSKSA
jgi:hypothetical protein